MNKKIVPVTEGFQPGQSTQEGQARSGSLDEAPENVAKGFYEKDARQRKETFEAAVSIGLPMVELLPEMLAGENPMARSGAKQVLFDITARFTAPGVPRYKRNALARALGDGMEDCPSERAREYLGWLREMVLEE